MEEIVIFDFDKSHEQFITAVLMDWQTVINTPFPLNLPVYGKVIVTVSLIIIGIFGLIFRGVILAFLHEPSIKLGPINVLLWIDQLNGLGQFGVILAILVGINVEQPLNQTFGDNFCFWINVPG